MAMRALFFGAIVFGWMVAMSAHLQAQTRDTLPPLQVPPNDTVRLLGAADTLAVADTMLPPAEPRTWVGKFFKKDYPNPKKALFLSLALPGAGQIYNRKWWKVPLVYGALGGLGYVEYNNLTEYRRWRDNYVRKVDDDLTNDPTETPFNRLDATTLRTNRDIARRNLELSSLLLGLGYLLNAADAFVDAHLLRFDMSDDLSVRPQPQMTPLGPAVGIAWTIHF